MLQDTETNILASPRIRARNKEKARILVGDKVPVITNLLTPQQAGATSVITGSIQYVDVGIKLEVEPQVYVDNDVGIKINLEVSNIAKTVETASDRLPDRHAQRADLAAPARRRDAGAGRPDQRPGPQHREQGAGARPGADRRQAVLLHQGRRDQERDRAVDHAAHRAADLPEARSGDVWPGTESVVREKPLRLDPIGAAKAGNVAEMPALAPSGGGGPRQGPSRPPGRRPAARAAASWAAAVRPRTARWRRPPQPVPRRLREPSQEVRLARRAVPARAPAPGRYRGVRRHRQQQPAAGADTSAAAHQHRSSRAAQWRRRRPAARRHRASRATGGTRGGRGRLRPPCHAANAASR
jgi:general secretion pathway protein D